MRKRSILLFGLLLVCSLASAQQYDVLEKVRADARKSWAMEGPHRFDEIGPQTPAPKGYKPFYISHYGRHGSRYAWNSRTYTLLYDVFTKAGELGVLTPYGKEFAQKYLDFYLIPWINTGDLVPLGFEQHEKIGQFVYDSFPQVFKGRRKVEAYASTSQRCIVSMGAFVEGLTRKNGDLQVSLASTHTGMSFIAPPSAPKALLRHFEGEDTPLTLESVSDFTHRVGPAKTVLPKLFTDSSFLSEFDGGEDKFFTELWAFITNYHNYETRPLFDDLFNDDERVAAWEVNNYFSFTIDIRQRYTVIPLLEDIIAKANAAFADPQQAAHLRFGHDYIVEAFATLLNLDHFGTVPATPEEAKYWFQSYKVPMAATLLFVFYKNRKGDVLFKVLWNENEAELPQLQPVQGPYYRWSDFIAWANGFMAAHPEIK